MAEDVRLRPLRIIFMGSPDFSVPALEALVAAGHTLVQVYSQPPRPAGRGQAERPCPVHARAVALGVPVRTPVSMRDAAEIRAFSELDADVCVVVAFGQILPKAVLDAPRLGCVNIHASVLPRWRGAAPIQRAIEAGDAETGITIMQMAEGLDTGDMIAMDATPISPTDTAAMLHDRLSDMGAQMIGPALEALETGTAVHQVQDEALVTYAHKIDKAEAKLDFAQPADHLARRVRAFSPFPGAWFEHLDAKGKPRRVKVLMAAAENGHGTAGGMAPGTTVDETLGIATGHGVLRPLTVQPSGKGAMASEAYLRGTAIPKGTSLA